MKDINIITLTGGLTKDAELKRANDTPVLTFSLGFNRALKRNGAYEDVANYIDCVLWGKLGEALVDKAVKGTQVSLQGELMHQKWQDKYGNNRYTYKIIVSNIRLHSRAGSTNSSAAQGQGAPKNDFDDDIPF